MCEFISAVSIYFIHNKEMLTAIFVSHTEKYFVRFSWKPIKIQKDEQNVFFVSDQMDGIKIFSFFPLQLVVSWRLQRHLKFKVHCSAVELSSAGKLAKQSGNKIPNHLLKKLRSSLVSSSDLRCQLVTSDSQCPLATFKCPSVLGHR